MSSNGTGKVFHRNPPYLIYAFKAKITYLIMRKSIFSLNYNTYNVYNPGNLSDMLTNREGDSMDGCFRIPDESGTGTESKLYSGDFLRTFDALHEAIS